MDYKQIISELDDKQIEELAHYASECTEQNLENIKNKFRAKTRARTKPAPRRKILLAASVAAVLILFSGFVYANIIDLGELFEKAFGSKAEYMNQYGTIISSGSTDNGIRLSLHRAIKDEEKLLIFFSLTDTDGDRLSPTMDLYDSWMLDQGFGGNCKLLGYDDETKTASFLITSVGASSNKKATLTIKSFLNSLEFRKGLKESGIDMKGLSEDYFAETVELSRVRQDGLGSGVSPDSKYNDDKLFDRLLLLEQDRLAIPFSNIDWSVISNIGFVNGELHVQTKLSDDTFSGIMSMHFTNESGSNVFTSELCVSYGRRTGGRSGAYEEFIFEKISDISQLQGLSLAIDTAEYGDYFTGNWTASFEVPSPVDKLKLPVPDSLTLANESIKADSILLSPLGLTVQYKTDSFSSAGENNDKAFVTYDDGTVVKFQFTSKGTIESNCTFTFSEPIIEIERVTSVNINGREIVLPDTD